MVYSMYKRHGMYVARIVFRDTSLKEVAFYSSYRAVEYLEWQAGLLHHQKEEGEL